MSVQIALWQILDNECCIVLMSLYLAALEFNQFEIVLAIRAGILVPGFSLPWMILVDF